VLASGRVAALSIARTPVTMRTPALVIKRSSGTTPRPDGLVPGKPTVSDTSDAEATRIASPAADPHEIASSTSMSCAAVPMAATHAITSSTPR
jgi:hypothetical protein